MVGVFHLAQYSRIDYPVAYVVTHHAVIYSPALVLGSCICTVAPPRIGIGQVLVNKPEAVGVSRL